MSCRKLLAILMIVTTSLTSCAFWPRSSVQTIEYKRSGGFAGLDDRLVITQDGTVTLTRKGQSYTVTISKEQMDQLLAALDNAQFSRLDRQYLPERKGADLFDYTITYKGRTVHTMDGAVPPQLQPILDLLETIITRAGGG